MSSAGPALAARAVTFWAGPTALVDDVSFTLEAGEVLGVLGPNGAGKSTLLRLVAGDLKAASGEIHIDGEEIGKLSSHALSRRRAVVSQATPLSFAFTALEVVMLGASVPGLAAGEASVQAAANSLERVGLEQIAHRPYTALSGGERQRVHIARALCQLALARSSGARRPVLLLDEPTASLDLGHQRLILDAVRGEAERGAAVLAVLHDLNLAAAYCDRIVMMRGGKVLGLGRPSTVFESRLLSEAYGCTVAVNGLPPAGIPFVLPITE